MMLSELCLKGGFDNMERNEIQSVDKIIGEYKEELKKLFKGERVKSFDKITGEAIEKMKNELKKAAEEVTEEENKKKQDMNVPDADEK